LVYRLKSLHRRLDQQGSFRGRPAELIGHLFAKTRGEPRMLV
jgi:hypothetical protein